MFETSFESDMQPEMAIYGFAVQSVGGWHLDNLTGKKYDKIFCRSFTLHLPHLYDHSLAPTREQVLTKH